MSSLIPQRNPTLATPSSIQVMKLQAKMLAEQITYLDCQFLEAIQLNEFLDQAWIGEEKESKAPVLSAYLEWLVQMKDWISTEILKLEALQDRSLLISKFIQVGMVRTGPFGFNRYR